MDSSGEPSRRRFIKYVIGAGAVAVAAGLGYSAWKAEQPTPTPTPTTTPKTTPREKLRVAWFSCTTLSDLGWSSISEYAIRKALEHFREREPDVEIEFQYEVGIPPIKYTEVTVTYCAMGFDYLWIPCEGHGPMMLEVAKMYPNVKISIGAIGAGDVFKEPWAYEASPEELSDMIPDNLQLVDLTRAWAQQWYLGGLVAGAATQTGIVGWSSGTEFPTLYRRLRAFEYGAKEINPDVRFAGPIWSKALANPDKGKEACLALIDAGADIVGEWGNQPGALQAASERDVWSISGESDLRWMFPDNVLCSCVEDQANQLINELQALIEKKWEGGWILPVELGYIYDGKKGGKTMKRVPMAKNKGIDNETPSGWIGNFDGNHGITPASEFLAREDIIGEDSVKLINQRAQQITDGVFEVPMIQE